MDDRKTTVEMYFEGFRRSDHALVLSLLTDDVAWDLPGFRSLTGKAAFDGEIENPDFMGSPTLVIDRLLEDPDRDAVVAIGTGIATPKAGDPFNFAFCDVFTFEGQHIRRVESYLVALG